MTQPGLVELIRSVDPETEGDSSVLRFTYQNTLMACISDTNANRMRIVAPIMSADELTDGHRQDMMIASYHLTLDVRYAEGDGVLYAIYLHPLDSFTEPELLNALPQLAALVANFGTSYASTPLLFGVPSEDNAPDPTPNPTVL